MFCEHCGVPLEEGARFCQRCGAVVAPGSEPSGAEAATAGPGQAGTAPAAPAKQPEGHARPPQALTAASPSRSRLAIIAAIAAVAVVIVALAVWQAGRSSNDSGGQPASNDQAGVPAPSATESQLGASGGQTSDLGPTGAPISGTVPPLHGVFFRDDSLGWAVGDDGTILATEDGGRSWQQQDSGTHNPLYGVAFVSDTDGWAVGETVQDGSVTGGLLLKTLDGGQTWKPTGPINLDPLLSITFSDPTHGVAGGWSGLAGGASAYITKDGGATWWGVLRTEHGLDATPVAMIDAKTWWSVGSEGMFITTNGGTSWRRANSRQLNDVWFADAQDGWGAGQDGVVATTDGGSSWARQESGNSASLSAIRFVDPLQGMVVGDGGTVLVTSDGGTTWVAGESGMTDSLDAVTCSDATHAWAVSGPPYGRGQIIASTDGGMTWVTQ